MPLNIPEVPQVPELTLDTPLKAPQLQRYSSCEYDKLSIQDFDAVDLENIDTSNLTLSSISGDVPLFEKPVPLNRVSKKKSKKKKNKKKRKVLAQIPNDNKAPPATKKMKPFLETEFLRFYDKDIQGLTPPCTLQNSKQQLQFYPPNDTRHVTYHNLVGGVYMELPHQYVTFGYKDAQKDSLYEDNNITILLNDSEHKTLIDALETTWSATMNGLDSTGEHINAKMDIAKMLKDSKAVDGQKKLSMRVNKNTRIFNTESGALDVPAETVPFLSKVRVRVRLTGVRFLKRLKQYQPILVADLIHFTPRPPMDNASATSSDKAAKMLTSTDFLMPAMSTSANLP